MSTIKNNALISQLIEFGLSEKEATIYLALLELEIAVVSDIAKETSINRSSTYVVLESLKKKGLVDASENKKVIRYSPTNPEMFLYEAENKAKVAQKIKDQIISIVPELKALHKGTKHKPKVKVYEGKEGIKSVYWDILYTEEAKDLKTFSDPVTIFKMFPNFMENSNERANKGIKMYAIAPITKELFKIPKPPAIDEMIVIPKDKFKSTNNVAIYGNKIGLISPKEEFGILIESKELSEAMRNIFDLAWEEAKRINKEVKK